MAQDIPAVADRHSATLDELVALLRSHEPDLRALGATSLHVFGSRARGHARADSDLDLVFDYDRDSRFSIVTLVGMKRRLEQATGIPVHITTANSIPERNRAGIDRDAVKVF